MAQPSTPEPRPPRPRAEEPRTYDELVASKTGAFRRLYTIVCVIILEILQRMAMMDNPALKPLPSTVLARAIAGDSFGLPAPLAATLRLLARELRRWVELPAPQPQVQPEPSASQPHAAPTGTTPRRRIRPRPAPKPRAAPRHPTFRIPLQIRATTGPPAPAVFQNSPKPLPHTRADVVTITQHKAGNLARPINATKTFPRSHSGMDALPPTVATIPARHRLAPRAIRLGGFGVILAVGLATVLDQQSTLRSAHAVITAPLRIVGSPIDGIIGQDVPPPGTRLRPGQTVATILNPRASTDRLTDLEATTARLTIEDAALAREQASLQALSRSLAAREAERRDAAAAQDTARIAGATHRVQASTARSAQFARALARQTVLAQFGVIPPMALEQARLDRFLAGERVAQDQADLAALTQARSVIRGGLLVDQDGGDLSPEESHRTAIDLRLADLAAERGRNLAARREAALRHAQALAEYALAGTATLTASFAPEADPMVWRRLEGAGAAVRVGQPIAQLVDCAAPIVLAPLPERRLRALRAGAPARILFYGEGQSRAGRLVAILPRAMLPDNTGFAVIPDRQDGTDVMAVIAADRSGPRQGGWNTLGPGHFCPVGTTALVTVTARPLALPDWLTLH